MSVFIRNVDQSLVTRRALIERQAPERHKTGGSERPILPFDGDWLMTEGVSLELD
ncbi:hypothetical protein [Peribacillus deserti]|uniref:hypothetical protein n=1 Tax=Peribacillus deserti TaxID=673318 RepID=UPI0015E0D1AA|nr:hypothetical protein [Peribacillus deserti]